MVWVVGALGILGFGLDIAGFLARKACGLLGSRLRIPFCGLEH